MQIHIQPAEISPGVSANYEAVHRKINEDKLIFGIKIKLYSGHITFWFNSESERSGFVTRIVNAVLR